MLIVGFLVFFFLLLTSQSAYAACANVLMGGSYTVSTSCTFSGAVDGVDNGGITVNSDQTLTINASQTVVWSPDNSIVINGSIAINNTGQLRQTYIWYTDQDVDGYPTTATPVAQDSQPAYGVRRKDFSNFTYVGDFTFDYDDTSTSTYPGVQCATCKTNQSDGTCIAVTDNTDPWADCSQVGCTDYIYGWSGLNCAKYSTSTASDGMCNASGACYTAVADSCTGVGATAASCGSAGCKMACATSSAATSYDTVAEICYVSAQNSCASGEECDGTGTCQSAGCGSDITDSRDSKVYGTVEIGGQCWMQENLVYDQSAYGSDSCYDNNCATYEATCGRLYSWPAAMQGADSSTSTPSGIQGACPEGWHIPSPDEWDVLRDELGGNLLAGGPLKEAGLDHWDSPNSGATNSSGFTALPCGRKFVDYGTYYGMGGDTQFWSSYADSNWYEIYYYLASSNGYFQSTEGTEARLQYSVRCLLD